jgi:hypothetical protein
MNSIVGTNEYFLDIFGSAEVVKIAGAIDLISWIVIFLRI